MRAPWCTSLPPDCSWLAVCRYAVYLIFRFLLIRMYCVCVYEFGCAHCACFVLPDKFLPFAALCYSVVVQQVYSYDAAPTNNRVNITAAHHFRLSCGQHSFSVSINSPAF